MHIPFSGRRKAAALLLTVAVISGGALTATPANATSTPAAHSVPAASKNSVSFLKIPGKTVSAKGTAKITPKIKKTGKVEVSKTTLTVKKGSSTVAKNKTSVSLRPGTYSVTQKVTYRTFTTKTTTTKVKKKVIGVPAETPVEVTCTASSLEPQFLDETEVEPWAYLAEVSCTSPKFDGPRVLELFFIDVDGQWGGITETLTDVVITDQLPSAGVAFGAVYVSQDDLMKTTYVTKKTTKKVYSKVITKTSSTQKLVIKKRR